MSINIITVIGFIGLLLFIIYDLLEKIEKPIKENDPVQLYFLFHCSSHCYNGIYSHPSS